MLVLQGRALPAGALTFDQLFEYWRTTRGAFDSRTERRRRPP